MVELLRKAVWQFLKKLNIEFPYDPAILPKKIENICPHRNLYLNVYNSTIHSSKKVGEHYIN